MRVVEIIELANEYNGLISKMNIADEWFLNPKVSEKLKNEFYDDKYKPLLKRIAEISGIFDQMGITYEHEKFNEVLEGIELPQELEKEKIKVGA